MVPSAYLEKLAVELAVQLHSYDIGKNERWVYEWYTDALEFLMQTNIEVNLFRQSKEEIADKLNEYVVRQTNHGISDEHALEVAGLACDRLVNFKLTQFLDGYDGIEDS